MEEKKKGNGGLIILIVILLLLCVGMGCFIFINKDKLFEKETEKTISEKEKTEKTTEVTKEVKERIERFIDVATTLNYGNNVMPYFMDGATSLTQEIKYEVVNQALYIENKVEENIILTQEETSNLEGLKPDNNEEVDIVKMTDYNEMYESLFNEESKYDVSVFNGCPGLGAVNKDKSKLYYFHRCGGTGSMEYERTIMSIELEDDYYIAHQKLIEKNLETGENKTILLKWKFDKNINFVSSEKE